MKKGEYEIDKMCFDMIHKGQKSKDSDFWPDCKGKESSTVSDGWLNKWRIWNNITFSADLVKFQMLTQWITFTMEMHLGYPVVNYLETHALKSKKCVGGKLCKERLTILCCTNMAGEKELLLVKGKAARPRTFKHLSLKVLSMD